MEILQCFKTRGLRASICVGAIGVEEKHRPNKMPGFNEGNQEERKIPLLASRHQGKEGWPRDKEDGAKHPCFARTGWFSD